MRKIYIFIISFLMLTSTIGFGFSAWKIITPTSREARASINAANIVDTDTAITLSAASADQEDGRSHSLSDILPICEGGFYHSDGSVSSDTTFDLDITLNYDILAGVLDGAIHTIVISYDLVFGSLKLVPPTTEQNIDEMISSHQDITLDTQTFTISLKDGKNFKTDVYEALSNNTCSLYITISAKEVPTWSIVYDLILSPINKQSDYVAGLLTGQSGTYDRSSHIDSIVCQSNPDYNLSNLISNSDYTVKVGNTTLTNDNKNNYVINAGEYIISVQYKDSKAAKFDYTVVPYSLSNFQGIVSIDPTIYNTVAQKLEPTIPYMNVVLSKNIDYTLSWNGDCINAGNYVVTVTAVANSNFKDSFTVEFRINPKNLNDKINNVSEFSFEEITGYQWNGLEQLPSDVEIIFLTPEVDATLVLGTDFTIAKIDNQDYVNSGSHQFNLIGKGNYTGTYIHTYVINKVDLTNGNDNNSTSKVNARGSKDQSSYGNVTFVYDNSIVQEAAANFDYDEIGDTIYFDGDIKSFESLKLVLNYPHYVNNELVTEINASDAYDLTDVSTNRAGAYTIKLTAKEDTGNSIYNYSGMIQVSFEIKPFIVNVTLENASVTYDTLAHKLTATYDNETAGENAIPWTSFYNLVYTNNEGNINAADYDVSVQAIKKANLSTEDNLYAENYAFKYNDVDVATAATATLTINPKDVSDLINSLTINTYIPYEAE